MKILFEHDLKDWLAENRWTPKSFAEEIGVSRQTIHHWIDGKAFPKNEDTIFNILRATRGELISFEENQKIPEKFKKLIKQHQAEQYFEIEGGQKLSGEITIPGAKNAALPMLCASLLTSEKCVFTDVPNITDVHILLRIFEKIGAEVTHDTDKKIVEVTAKNIDPNALKNCDLVKKFRASILIVGPLLARFGKAEVMKPGGCVIGARPNDIHLNGFENFGAKIKEDSEKIYLQFPGKFTNHQTLLPEASVTATENLAMFAAGVPEKSELFFTATETHVTATLEMLREMGAEIEGIRTHRLKISGKNPKSLKGGTFQIPPDGLLAATYGLAGVLTEGDLTINNVYHTELLSFYGLLRRTGAQFEFSGDSLKISGNQSLKAIPKLQTAIFPGFSTDLQSPFGILLSQCEGQSMIFETLFENRLTYLLELEKMGANIELLNSHQAKITGKTKLKGTEVRSWDLRAGAAMVLAGLIAEGTTKVTNINYIDRGYEDFDQNLQNLGANIVRKRD